VVIASCDNFLDIGSSSEHLDKCTAYTTGSACDDNIHELLPATRCTGPLLRPAPATTTLLQHILPLGSCRIADGSAQPMPGGFIDCHFRLRVAGRVYHHALKYLPV